MTFLELGLWFHDRMRTNRSASLLWSQSHVENGSVEEHESVRGGGLFSFMEELYDVVVVEVPGGEGGLVPGPRVLVA